MPIFAAVKYALVVVVVVADFLARCREWLLWNLHCWRTGEHVGEPAEEQVIEVPVTSCWPMVILQEV